MERKKKHSIIWLIIIVVAITAIVLITIAGARKGEMTAYAAETAATTEDDYISSINGATETPYGIVASYEVTENSGIVSQSITFMSTQGIPSGTYTVEVAAIGNPMYSNKLSNINISSMAWSSSYTAIIQNTAVTEISYEVQTTTSIPALIIAWLSNMSQTLDPGNYSLNLQKLKVYSGDHYVYNYTAPTYTEPVEPEEPAGPDEATGIDSITVDGSGTNVEPTQELYLEWTQSSDSEGNQGRAIVTTIEDLTAGEYTVKIAFIGDPLRATAGGTYENIGIGFINNNSQTAHYITKNDAGITEDSYQINITTTTNQFYINWFYNNTGAIQSGTYWINILQLQITDNSGDSIVNYQSYLYDYLQGQFENSYDDGYNQGAIDSTTPSENLIPDFTGANLPNFKIYRQDEPSGYPGGTIDNIINPSKDSNDTWNIAIANWYDNPNSPTGNDISENVYTQNLTSTEAKNALTIGVGSDTFWTGKLNGMDNGPIYGFYLYTLVENIQANISYNISINLSRDYPPSQQLLTSQAFYIKSDTLQTLSIEGAALPYMDGVIPRVPEENLTTIPENTTAIPLSQAGTVDLTEITLAGNVTFNENGSYIIGFFVRIDYETQTYFPANDPINITLSNPYIGTGTDLGFSQGYQNGYNDGYDEGEKGGYNNGYNTGYIEGNEAGYQTGYNKGHEDGIIAGEGLSSTIGSLMNTVQAGLNTNLIGEISIGDLLSVMLGILLTFAVIRFFGGG